MAYGTVRINEIIAQLDAAIGTDWKSGTASEIVASIEGAGDITLTGVLVGTNIAANANAPGTNAESVALIGQKDSSSASKATLDIETEEVVVTEACVADTSFAIWVNGVEYKLPLLAV